MTKAELVEDVARAAELTKKDAERLVEIVFESIIETLNQGEKIELRGLAAFACASAARGVAEIRRLATRSVFLPSEFHISNPAKN
jgi:nucleoid DNA-binding protein